MKEAFNKNQLIQHCMKEYNWALPHASLAVDRYEKLFKLFGKGISIVPTKEIDDVWHIHMLNPISYYESCMEYHGKLIGHNPALENSEAEKDRLHSQFLVTANIWKETYGEEYTGSVSDCDGPDHSCTECSTGNCMYVEATAALA